jgi:hypothetical protein
MTSVHNGGAAPRKPIRLWPGVAIVAIIVLTRFIGLFVPEGGMVGFLASAAGGVLILLWWLLFSRAPWTERIGAMLLIAVAAFLTRFALHPSITGGAMGYLGFVLLIVSVPPMLVGWAVLARRFSPQARWATMALAMFVGCGVWLLARTDGVKGEGGFQITWRWTTTAEERLLAQTRNETLPPPPAPAPVAVAAPAPTPDKTVEPAATTRVAARACRLERLSRTES